MKEKLFAKIDGYLDYAVELETKLSAIPAIAPVSGGEGEYDKAQYLLGELKKLKFDDIQVINAPDPKAKNGVRPNVIARYKGEKSDKTFWIMSHIDVVPPGEMSLWKTDPYKAVKEGNKIYGRGTEDNQQGMVSSMLALKAMMELGIRPACDTALLFNADEEVGSHFGIIYLLKNNPEMFGKNDIFLVPDGGNHEGTMVEVAEKSICWLKFTVLGKQCHASMPGDGNNANRAASELIVKLEDLYTKFNAKDELFTPSASTFEPTKREANVPNVNTIPGEDVFYLDSRILPQYKIDDIIAHAQKLAKEVEDKRKVQVKIETVIREDAAPPTSPTAEITTLTMSAIKDVYKSNPEPMGIGGGTVAAPLRKAGYSSVVYCKMDHMAHMPNEYCVLDNLIGDAKVMAHIALNVKP